MSILKKLTCTNENIYSKIKERKFIAKMFRVYDLESTYNYESLLNPSWPISRRKRPIYKTVFVFFFFQNLLFARNLETPQISMILS